MKDLCLVSKEKLIELIDAENQYQLRKWGIQNRTPSEWMMFLTEEVGELANAISEEYYREGSPRDVVDESIQVATLALKVAEMYLEKEYNNEAH